MPAQETKNRIHNEPKTSRPPIVVVLGHVDHGKSSLLEAVREDFLITPKEAGGITQHIGAYEAEYQGRKITFIDTPGHKAFSAMRSRGAKVADIALLVVAADDGVKPQTEEAIEHIQEAKLPFIVVFSKMDRSGANTERVKQDLAQKGVLLESFGGKVPVAETSASAKQGIPELLELILLMADMEQLSDEPELPAQGVVIESFLDSRRGPATTLLVRKGILRQGDIVGTPTTSGKVRILENFQGEEIKEARASQPALVLGFEAAPAVGEEFYAFSRKEEAIAFGQADEAHEPATKVSSPETEELQTLPLVVKADTVGSLEALLAMLSQLPQEDTQLCVVQAEVGDVGEADIKHAQGTKACVLAFRVKTSPGIKELAERLGVRLEQSEIIYEAVQRVEELLAERKVQEEEPRKEAGKARILAVFGAEKKQQVVGGTILEGEARKNMEAEILRGEEKVGEGVVRNIQQNREDVPFVPTGEEFGMLLAGAPKLQEGDILLFYFKGA